MNVVSFPTSRRTRRANVSISVKALTCVAASCFLVVSAANTRGGDTIGSGAWQGEVHLDFAAAELRQAGLSVELRGQATTGGTPVQRLSSSVSTANDWTFDVDDVGYPLLSGTLDTAGAILLNVHGRRHTIGNLRFLATDDGPWSVRDGLPDAEDSPEVLRLIPTAQAFQRGTQRLQIQGDLVMSEELLRRLNAPHLADRRIATVTIRLEPSPAGAPTPAEEPAPSDAVPSGTASVAGPDVIVGDLHQINNYGVFVDKAAFSVGTVSCNVGDTELAWIASTNQHPTIAQNMYRLKAGRFEQIGMSWLKHGFFAVSGGLCFSDCQGTDGTALGVHCSDPYSANLNGSQNNLGPRFEVNAFTGEFNYPPADPFFASSTSRRLQVNLVDLDQSFNAGATYFVEGHYVTPDDAAAGNHDNNASYREATVTGVGNDVEVSLSSVTRRTLPAIRAWQAMDPTVVLTDVHIPGEGYLILGAKSTDLGDGFWSYEYAIQNINSHRSAAWFRVPVDPTTTVRNIGFHDVSYHSGEPFDGTDWSMSRSSVTITWSTTPFDTFPFANALRWGTLYNFRFEADVPPTSNVSTIGLFRPGTPDRVEVATVGPASNVTDCNGNDVPDSADIADGFSEDCNGNAEPDECETHTPMLTLWGTGFVDPVAVTGVPGNADRVLVAERTGRIQIHENGQVLATPLLDLTGSVANGPEQGLLGLAVDPDFAANGHAFVAYSNLAGSTVISRFSVNGDPNQLDPSTEVILKIVPQPFDTRNGGVLSFGADGMLYVGMGDGGGTDDPLNSAQEPGSLLGKVLRLDPDQPPDYIPVTNPFVATALPLDEIWSLGVRQPRGLSVDTATGDVFVPDHGQDAVEEINIHRGGTTAGENYAWRCMEGDTCTGLSGCTCFGASLTQPDITFPSDATGCGVVGGGAYRGCVMPDWTGVYYYADTCAGSIHALRYVNGAVTEWQDVTNDLFASVGSIATVSAFGADGIGELYVATTSGELYKIVSNPAVCGNGTPEPGEGCDDGNLEPGDGCTEFCDIEPPASNDVCENAFAVSEGLHNFSTANAATDGPDEPILCDLNGQSTVDGDVWFCYTATCRGTATVSTCTGDFDSRVAVYAGCECPTAASTAIACDDDGCGLGTQQVFEVQACESYLIRVGGSAGETGTGAVSIGCTPDPLVTDCNGNLTEDDTDIVCQTSTDGNANGIPDECETSGDPILGGRLYDNWWSELSASPPILDHPLWQYRPDPISNPQTGATTWRCKECHGWDYEGVDGQYATGSHRTGFPGILGTTLEATDMFTLLREPPSNGGGPGVPNGHDYGSVLPDIRITDLVAFAIGGAVDNGTFIDETDGTFLGDPETGSTNYQFASTPPCTLCHGANGATINFGTFNEPEYLGTVANTNPWEMLHKIRFGQPNAPMPSWLANGGTNQGAADIGRFCQLSLATECIDPAQCDDGVTCTNDTCAIDGTCAFSPDDSNCADDGLFCNGPEICDEMLDCVSAGNPCTGVCDEVDACGCLPPLVTGAGGRYLAVTPQAMDSATPMGLLVTPTCALGQPRYVGQPVPPFNVAPLVDSRAKAAFLTSEGWGTTVYVFGQDIVPETEYEVRSDCGGPEPAISPFTQAQTLLWGDVSGASTDESPTPPDGLVNFRDIKSVVDGFLQNPNAPTVYASDLFGCRPAQIVDFSDVRAAILAFLGQDYPEASLCPGPCWD